MHREGKNTKSRARIILPPLFLGLKLWLTYISHCDIKYITKFDITEFDISKRIMEVHMDAHIKKVYVPMTETGFYILFCLQKEMHGYNIGLKVKDMTNGELTISPGTMYGTLSKMENDKLISFVKEEDKRKSYIITELGKEVLEIELRRIERLYRNSRGEY